MRFWPKVMRSWRESLDLTPSPRLRLVPRRACSKHTAGCRQQAPRLARRRLGRERAPGAPTLAERVCAELSSAVARPAGGQWGSWFTRWWLGTLLSTRRTGWPCSAPFAMASLPSPRPSRRCGCRAALSSTPPLWGWATLRCLWPAGTAVHRAAGAAWHVACWPLGLVASQPPCGRPPTACPGAPLCFDAGAQGLCKEAVGQDPHPAAGVLTGKPPRSPAPLLCCNATHAPCSDPPPLDPDSLLAGLLAAGGGVGGEATPLVQGFRLGRTGAEAHEGALRPKGAFGCTPERILPSAASLRLPARPTPLHRPCWRW
jgi:hypothetical protein